MALDTLASGFRIKCILQRLSIKKNESKQSFHKYSYCQNGKNIMHNFWHVWKYCQFILTCTAFWNHSSYRYCRNRKTSLATNSANSVRYCILCWVRKTISTTSLQFPKQSIWNNIKWAFCIFANVICTDLGLWSLAAYIFSFSYPITTFFSLSLFSDFSSWAALSAHGFLPP